MNLWQETIKSDGTSSIQSHKPKVVARYCKFEDHIVDNEFPSSRVVVCKVCGKQIPLILGFHEIKDNHIFTVSLKR